MAYIINAFNVFYGMEEVKGIALRAKEVWHLVNEFPFAHIIFNVCLILFETELHRGVNGPVCTL